MEHVEYVYTSGLTEAEIDRRLREGRHGVLSLADGGDAYAVPLSYDYDGEHLRLRVVDYASSAIEKEDFIDTTETATFVVTAPDEEWSWSVVVRGSLARRPDVDDATLNEWFEPLRLFGESVEEATIEVYELELESVTGRALVA